MGEHWVGYIGNLQVHWDTLITMWVAMLFVIIASLLLTRKLSVIPGKAQAFAESML